MRPFKGQKQNGHCFLGLLGMGEVEGGCWLFIFRLVGAGEAEDVAKIHFFSGSLRRGGGKDCCKRAYTRIYMRIKEVELIRKD